jgi:hypothetical protein
VSTQGGTIWADNQVTPWSVLMLNQRLDCRGIPIENGDQMKRQYHMTVDA